MLQLYSFFITALKDQRAKMDSNTSSIIGQSFSKQSKQFVIGGHTITPKQGSGFSISDGTCTIDVFSYRTSCGAGKWKYQGLFGQLKINGQIFVDDDKIVKV